MWGSPTAGAAHSAVHVIFSPASSTESGHEIAPAGMTSSVTVTPMSVVFPMFSTSKVTLIVAPAVVDTAVAESFAS